MDYIRIAKINDFKNKHIKSFSLFGKKIGVIKPKDNSFYAIEISCKHQGADLTAGKIEGTVATCHRHQWKSGSLFFPLIKCTLTKVDLITI